MSASRFENRMNRKNVPMMGRYFRASFSPMTLVMRLKIMSESTS